jgi:catechol 2,3-dioxygenase-like lactoylglutathione lyase family enzyme
MRLRRAMIFVKNLDRMAAFYGDTLGLNPIPETRTASWVEFDAGIALHAVPAELGDRIEISTPARLREENPIKLIFEAADVASERARLETLGIAMTPRPWGACDGADPEGNIFQICAAPGSDD